LAGALASAVAAPGADRRGQVDVLHFVIEQAVRNTYAVLFVAGFVALIAGPVVGWPRFAAWAGATGAAFGIRALLLRPGLERAQLERDAGRWSALLFGSTVLSGIIGASAALLFFPLLPPLERMFLTMILCCWVTGAMTSVGVYPALYSAYAAIFIGQLVLAWLLSGQRDAWSIAVLLGVYGVIMNGFARSFARQVAEGFVIRQRNERLIQELDAARDAAEAASLAKSRFLAIASHDLRQPLHALTILSGLLGRRSSPETIGDVAQQIARSVGTLEKLFAALLDLSRLEVGALQPELRPASAAAVVEELAAEFRPRAQAKGLRFEAHGCEVAIVTDRTLLERILRNFVDNAVKYTERGTVGLACERRADAVVFSVRDTGPGIRPQEREAIFEEFYQAPDERPHRERGLGLGLAIVKRLSGALGYSIETESELGAGSTFRLLIPASRISALAPHPAGEAQAGAEVSLEGFGVVYVDDDVAVHEAMALLLREWGCRAVVAATLDAVRTRLREEGLRPEAVLSDYSLGGGLTGLEVIEALRAEHGALPAAIITGESAPGTREQLSRSEYPVLLKPVQPQELRRLLEVFRSVG
jgi:two-component system, sensor histidine kinase